MRVESLLCQEKEMEVGHFYYIDLQMTGFYYNHLRALVHSRSSDRFSVRILVVLFIVEILTPGLGWFRY